MYTTRVSKLPAALKSKVGAVDVLPATTNTGSAALAVTRTGAAALTPYDYVMRYDGSAWSMQRADNGAAVRFTGTGTVSDPILAGGVAIVLSGAAVAGDRFLVRPTSGAIRNMDVLITDPARVADLRQ